MANLEWSRGPAALRHRIAMVLAAAVGSAIFQAAQAEEASGETAQEVAELSDMEVTEDPLRALSTEPSESAFGFAKPLLETPRSASR